MDIPKLSLDVPPGWFQRDINVNEQLDIVCSLDKSANPDLLDFSTQVIYNFEIVGIIRFDYFKMRVAIWERFLDFSGMHRI
jgi:predicted SAM-dependent methyltransferase